MTDDEVIIRSDESEYELEVDLSKWEPSGCEEHDEQGGWCRLLATLYINAIPHHMEAIAAHIADDGMLVADCSTYEQSLDAMCVINGAVSDHFIEHEGRTYLVDVVPFG